MANNKKKTGKSTKKTNNKTISNTKSKNPVKNNKNTVLERAEEFVDNDSLYKKFIVALCVLAILGLFYLLAIHITEKNDTSGEDPKEEETIVDDYSEILLGSSFNRSEKEYMVVYYDYGNQDIKSTLNTTILDYLSKDDNLTVYKVDMSNVFNKSYVTEEETNKEPSSVDELKINGPTLIKFKDNKVVDYVEGLDEVKAYLG